jgi:MFS family permease
MQRNVLRALLLAMTVLLIGALPAAAQDDDKGWLLANEDDSALIAVQRDIAVGQSETADGVVIVDGQAAIEGSVESIFAVDADVTISGSSASVERVFTIAGTLTIADGATIGDAYYTGTEVTIDEANVTVTGEVTNAQEEVVGALAAVLAVLVVLVVFVVIGAFIATMLMTLLVIAFGTAQTRRAAATISNDVLKTLVVGILMLVVPSILFGILFATIVGIPVAIGMLLLWGFVLFLGQVVVATWIGERILPRARVASRPYGAAFLGMLILLLLSWTWIVPLLAGVFGTGAVTLAGWRVLRGGGVPPVPPGYGQPYGQPLMVPPPPYAPPPYAPPVQQPPAPGGWPPQGGQPPSSWPQG